MPIPWRGIGVLACEFGNGPTKARVYAPMPALDPLALQAGLENHLHRL